MIGHELILLIAIIHSSCNGDIDIACLSCICEVEGCEGKIGSIDMDDSEIMRCGPYQITNSYWNDCGSPGGDWLTCTKQKTCSEACVRTYMQIYGTRCTDGRDPTCKDYAKIHNGGPNGCETLNNDDYWIKVKKCLGMNESD